MSLRPTQRSTFALVRSGLLLNQTKLARAQEQVATGKRILAPSDDAIGTAISMSVRRQGSSVSGWVSAIETARPHMSSASSQLEDASNLLTEARARLLEGMNGALSFDDRESVAIQLELIYGGLLEVANARSGERYLFAGTKTATQPFVETTVAGRKVVEYRGDEREQSILVGRGVRLEINVTGEAVFAAQQQAGVSLGQLTGVRLGTSANSGAGFHDLHLRHDATSGAPGAGITLGNGGADDTILGDHVLVVDAAAGTAQLGSGRPVQIGDPPPAALEVTDADGSRVVLDFSAWTGADTTATLTGAGSIALDDGLFTPITLTETDLELVVPESGTVLHVDTTGVSRATDEIVTFSGTVNLFDVLRGAIDDLRSGSDVSAVELQDRLEIRLGEFDRNQRNLLAGLGRMGAREERVIATDERLRDLEVHLESLRSSVEEADPSEVVLEMTRTEQTLQVAQATGARLIQQTLLNFLR